MSHIFKTSLLKGKVAIPVSVIRKDGSSGPLNQEIETVGAELRELIIKKFKRSLHIREVDTGSCGACESEIISTTNPIYDIQRFGINFVASPRHADMLLVAGALSRNMLLALKKTYEAMPGPKFIVTLGDCAFDGSIFKDSYYFAGPVKSILPVAFHIPGCPPTPLTIMKHLLVFLQQF
jgi:Ni,Fe-hydrogenase III small subunit